MEEAVPIKRIQGNDATFLVLWTHQCHLTPQGVGHGDLWYLRVLSLFSSSISVIQLFMCCITVSSSPAVCCFSSLWLMVFSKKLKILCGIAKPFIYALLSNTGQNNLQHKTQLAVQVNDLS